MLFHRSLLCAVLLMLLASCIAQQTVSTTNIAIDVVLREKLKAASVITTANDTMNLALREKMKEITNTTDADDAAKLALREKLKSANVMLCTIVKNEQLYIDEWLEYHRYMGFDYAQIYDNAHNASAYLASLPEKYGNFVRVTHYPGLGKQREVYAKCMNEHANDNTWGAFIDVDEFFVLRKHANIKSFLHEVAPEGGSVALGWSIMGSNGTMTRKPGPVVARFTLTSTLADMHTKTIAYLAHAKEPIVHNVFMKPGHPTVDQHGRPVSPDSPFVHGNDRKVAYINHYYTKSWEEFQAKRHRGKASSFKSNHMWANVTEARHRIIADYKMHNERTNVFQDTTARDFYLRNQLGDAFQFV